MSKVRMKRIFICGPKQKRKAILELLQRTGVVQIEAEDFEDSGLSTMDVNADRARFLRLAASAEQALGLLDQYAPDGSNGLLSSLEDARDIGKEIYEKQAAGVDGYMETAEAILAVNKQLSEDKSAIPRCENLIESYSAWTSLDIPLDTEGTGSTRVFIGSVPEELDGAGLYGRIHDALKEDIEDMEIELLSASKNMTSFVAVCHRDDAAELEAALRSVNFVRAPESEKIPLDEIDALKQQISAYEADIKKCEEDIAAYAPHRDSLKFAADYYRGRAGKYEVLGHIPQSGSAFFISGFTPADTAEKLTAKLEALDAVVELSDPEPGEEIPTKLKNGFLADPMETTIVESYSYPNSHEIDPTTIVACFYYIMFGMMLSDAGYGLLLVLGCGFVYLKVKNMKPGMKKMMKLMILSGITTTFWGFMFGSFFGDAVNVIATTFFGRPDIALNPIWFNPQTEPMRLLVVAFIIGIIHLFTGLTIKMYDLLKEGKVADAIFDVVFWYMFIGGAIVYLLTLDMITGMFNLEMELGPVVANVSMWVAILGAVGVALTDGRSSKNPVIRIAKGLYGVYGCTSWLSDLLSYSRLLALGLATGCIAQVFNKMGSMVAEAVPLPIGVVIFIVIFVAGHALNIGINVLGAYVHTNRLQFVEFMGKFYEGGGTVFTPFRENTRYYKVKEDI